MASLPVSVMPVIWIALPLPALRAPLPVKLAPCVSAMLSPTTKLAVLLLTGAAVLPS